MYGELVEQEVVKRLQWKVGSAVVEAVVDMP
jgi:hypothetical protein